MHVGSSQKKADSGTLSSLSTPDDPEAAEANLRMERKFYGREEGVSSAEAVDPAELFRNQS